MTADASGRGGYPHAKAKGVLTKNFPKLCVLASWREKMNLWQTPDAGTGVHEQFGVAQHAAAEIA